MGKKRLGAEQQQQQEQQEQQQQRQQKSLETKRPQKRLVYVALTTPQRTLRDMNKQNQASHLERAVFGVGEEEVSPAWGEPHRRHLQSTAQKTNERTSQARNA